MRLAALSTGIACGLLGCGLVSGPICLGVATTECIEAATVAVGNLGWARASFVGPATVSHGRCPDRLDDRVVEGTPCWHVTLPLDGGLEPEVVMGLYEGGHIGQIGGDAISGQMISPYASMPAD